MEIEIEYLEKLREINFGEAIGKSKQWSQENRLLINSIDEPEFHGAETWRELWNRIESVCRDIVAGEAENIILVSHGGALAVWHQGWFTFDVRERKIGPPGGVSFIEINNNGERIISRLNDLSYTR